MRLTLRAVAPTVILAPQTTKALSDSLLEEATLLQASQAAHDECRPIDDLRSTSRLSPQAGARAVDSQFVAVFGDWRLEIGDSISNLQSPLDMVSITRPFHTLVVR